MKKSLLKENRKALQFLHMAKGFDFEKPHEIFRGEGRFTYNQLKKEIENRIDGSYVAGVLIRPNERKYSNRTLYYATFSGGKLDGRRQDGAEYYNYNISYAWGVGDFEEMRKNQTAHYYVVAQSAEHIRTPKRQKWIEYTERFRLDASRSYNPGRTKDPATGKTWISSLALIHVGGTGEQVEYRIDRFGYHSDKLEDILDKSGYIVAKRRLELKRKAARLREKRQAEEAQRADFSHEEKKLYALLEAKKCTLSRAIMRAKVFEDAVAFERGARDFRWALYDLEEYEDRKKERGFRDLEHRKTLLRRAWENLEKIAEV